MLRFIIGRLGRALISMFIVLTAVFCLMRLLPTDGYFQDRSDSMDEKVKEQVLQSLGLLDPLHVQLGNFWKDLIFNFDLGDSIVYRTGVPNSELIGSKIKYSLYFGLAALVLQKLIGLPMGVLMARYKGGVVDKLGNLYILLINALPPMVYFLLLQLSLSDLMGVSMIYRPTDPSTWIIPVILLSLGGIAADSMWMRRYMVDQVNLDYVRLARAKGMTSSQVAFKHIMRNAFIPMAQALPTSLIFTISGSLYIEALFSIPGTGGLLITAIQRQDNTLVQAMVLMYSAMSVCGLLLGDIAMMLCDPRIKLSKKEAGR